MPDERSPLRKLLRKLLLGEPLPEETKEPEDGDEAPDGMRLKAKLEDEVGYVQGKERKERSPDHPE